MLTAAGRKTDKEALIGNVQTSPCSLYTSPFPLTIVNQTVQLSNRDLNTFKFVVLKIFNNFSIQIWKLETNSKKFKRCALVKKFAMYTMDYKVLIMFDSLRKRKY